MKSVAYGARSIEAYTYKIQIYNAVVRIIRSCMSNYILMTTLPINKY